MAEHTREVTRKLADWRALLRRDITAGREVLRALLLGPLRFTPVNDGRLRGYRFEGLIASIDCLLEWLSCKPKWRPQRVPDA